MTVSYAPESRLLLRWRGSIWKSIWLDLLIYLILYYIIAAVYNFWLDEYQCEEFERLSVLFNEYTKQIPLTFLLGFYVALIMKRWWDQFSCVSWPEDILSMVCALWPISDDATTNKRHADCRHTIARYINLSCVICWREISQRVRARWPTLQHVVQCGLMTNDELSIYENTTPSSIRWQLPLQWIQRIGEQQFIDGKVPPPLMGSFLNELRDYRNKFRKLYCFDWVSVPLVYTQVATIATYGYFGFCLLGRQFLDVKKHYPNNDVNFYVPIFTIVQFIFYIGWFKVGKDFMRPFGCDDDDIELNYILDRNVAASFALVHNVPKQKPDLDDTENLHGNPLFPDPKTPGATGALAQTVLSTRTAERAPKLHAQVRMKRKDDAEMQVPTANDETKMLSIKRTKEDNTRLF